MADLYLVRHGQTELNVQNILQGWQGSPLTERGREQALTVRTAFAARGVAFDHVYSSPLGRARRTAELIIGEDRSIALVDNLREWHLGSLEGTSNRKMPAQPWGDYPVAFGGESESELRARMVARCPALWSGRSTTACWQSPTALPARSFLSMWPAGENSPTTAPCFILAIATGRFRSLIGNERKDPYE